VLSWILPLAPAPAQELPEGFAWQTLAEGLTQPVALAFAPGGDLYIGTKPGLVLRLPESGGSPQLVLDWSSAVNNHGDRGLLGLALHPGFVPDGGPTAWIYLLVTLSPLPGVDPVYDFDGQYSWSALVRLRATTQGSTVTAGLNSLHYLLGERQPDGLAPTAIASLHQSHSNGSLCFGRDGSLLIATGDGARYFDVDVGGLDPLAFEDAIHPTTGLKGPYSKDQDSGALRARSLASLAGKVLRVDPESGLGLASNPHFDGNPGSLASRIFAQGFRNPFRMAVDPSQGSPEPSVGRPGLVVVGDVGSAYFEELNAFAEGGFDGGWPCFEGPNSQPDYSQYNAPQDAPGIGLDCADLGLPSWAPSLAWNRINPSETFPAGKHLTAEGSLANGFTGGCAIAGEFYQGLNYPETWRGGLFFSDFVAGWLKVAAFGSDAGLLAVRDFAEGWPRVVDVAARPADGDLVFLFLGNGQQPSSIRRLRYGENHAPSASLEATPSQGPLPLTALLDASGSGDADQDALVFRFDFGDGNSLGPTSSSTALHTYQSAGLFEARVEVDDGQGGSASASRWIAAGISGTTIAIFSPQQGALLQGQDLGLSAAALDSAGQPLAIAWHVDRFQGGVLLESTPVASGTPASLSAEFLEGLGAAEYLRLRANASDGLGQNVEASRYLFPEALWRSVSGAGALLHCLEALEPPLPQGASNTDPEVLRDHQGVLASSGPEATFDSQHPGLQGAPVWFGVARPPSDPAPVLYAGVDLVTGLSSPTSGWFESLAVEVLQDGTWHGVPGLCALPAYADLGSQGPAVVPAGAPSDFTPVRLRFAPTLGTALRVIGQPAAGGFVSLAELEVFALQAAPNSLVDHSQAGQPIARVLTLDPPGPQGAGNPNPELWRDGTTPNLGSTSLWAQFDSQHPAPPPGDDWFGYRFAAPVSLQQLRFQGGSSQAAGGNLVDLTVEFQAQPDGPWQSIEDASITPPWPRDPAENPGYSLHQIDFPVRAVLAVRVAGAPSGSAQFGSCAELRVYGPYFDAGACGFATYGNSDLGGVVLSSNTKPAPGLPVALAITGGEPAGMAFLGISLAPADLLLAEGQRLLISPLDLLLLPLALSANGSAAVHKTLAENPNLVGVGLYFQALALDPAAIGGWRFSNGLSMHVCP
jgi:glucose/arabinose dehydrogenase